MVSVPIHWVQDQDWGKTLWLLSYNLHKHHITHTTFSSNFQFEWRKFVNIFSHIGLIKPKFSTYHERYEKNLIMFGQVLFQLCQLLFWSNLKFDQNIVVERHGHQIHPVRYSCFCVKFPSHENLISFTVMHMQWWVCFHVVNLSLYTLWGLNKSIQDDNLIIPDAFSWMNIFVYFHITFH